MRLWSISPHLLDTKRLVSQWKEGITMMNIWKKKTDCDMDGTEYPKMGYANHPQVMRMYFLDHTTYEDGSKICYNTSYNTYSMIQHYLSYIYEESRRKNYNFNIEYVKRVLNLGHIEYKVPVFQVLYEIELMRFKNSEWYRNVILPEMEKEKPELLNPVFDYEYGIVQKIESREVIKEEVYKQFCVDISHNEIYKNIFEKFS